MNPSGNDSLVSAGAPVPQLSTGKFFSRHVKLSSGIIESDAIGGFIFPCARGETGSAHQSPSLPKKRYRTWTRTKAGRGELIPHECAPSADFSTTRRDASITRKNLIELARSRGSFLTNRRNRTLPAFHSLCSFLFFNVIFIYCSVGTNI